MSRRAALLLVLAFISGFTTATPPPAQETTTLGAFLPVPTPGLTEAPQRSGDVSALDQGWAGDAAGSGALIPCQPEDLGSTPSACGASPAPVAVLDSPSPTVGASPEPSPVPLSAPGSTWNRAVASWYGPGFYGNRTACGQTYSATLWGVAHKTLPCGTLVWIRYNGRTVDRPVPVSDRGPYIAGRTWDLSAAVAGHLRFTGVHTVEWHR